MKIKPHCIVDFALGALTCATILNFLHAGYIKNNTIPVRGGTEITGQTNAIKPSDLEIITNTDRNNDGVDDVLLVVKGKDGKLDREFYLKVGYPPDGKPSVTPVDVDNTYKPGYNPK